MSSSFFLFSIVKKCIMKVWILISSILGLPSENHNCAKLWWKNTRIVVNEKVISGKGDWTQVILKSNKKSSLSHFGKRLLVLKMFGSSANAYFLHFNASYDDMSLKYICCSMVQIQVTIFVSFINDKLIIQLFIEEFSEYLCLLSIGLIGCRLRCTRKKLICI